MEIYLVSIKCKPLILETLYNYFYVHLHCKVKNKNEKKKRRSGNKTTKQLKGTEIKNDKISTVSNRRR